LEKTRKHALGLERMLAFHETETLIQRAERVKGIRLIAEKVSYGNQIVIREMIDNLRGRNIGAIIVLGAIIGGKPFFVAAVSRDIISLGYDASIIVKRVSEFTGGGGGGKADFAQGSGIDSSKIDAALSLVKKLV
jgi:alanyl-tRNA synthetase